MQESKERVGKETTKKRKDGGTQEMTGGIEGKGDLGKEEKEGGDIWA